MEYKPKNLRGRYGMTRKEFCSYFHLPYKTVQKWETGERALSKYEYDLFRKNLEWRQQMYEQIVKEDLNSEDFPGKTGKWYVEGGRLGVETEYKGKKYKKLLNVCVTPSRLRYIAVYGVWALDELLSDVYWEDACQLPRT